MMRSFGISDDENLSSTPDNSCETNSCPTAPRQGQGGSTFVRSSNAATSRVSTPPPSFSPVTESAGNTPRRRVCPAGTTSTRSPNRGGGSGSCPYAYAPDSHNLNATYSVNRAGSPRSPRNATYTVAPGSDVSSAFYGLSDSEGENSTSVPNLSTSHTDNSGGQCTCSNCVAGNRSATNRSGRRLSFEDTSYQSPLTSDGSYPSGSTESSDPECSCPNVGINASYISSLAGECRCRHPLGHLVRNPTMFDTPGTNRTYRRPNPPRTNQAPFTIYEDSNTSDVGGGTGNATYLVEGRQNIYTSTPVGAGPTVSFGGSANLSTIDEYGTFSCTDESCPNPVSGSWPSSSSYGSPSRAMGNTYNVQQNRINATYGVQAPRQNQTYNVSAQPRQQNQTYNVAAQPRQQNQTYNVAAQPRQQNQTYNVSTPPRQPNQTYSVSPPPCDTCSSPYYSSSYSDYTPPNFYTPPSRYGEWDTPPFHSTTIDSSQSGGSSGYDASGSRLSSSRSRSPGGNLTYSGGDQSSSLGILGSGYFDTTRITTDESSLGLLGCSCFETTPVDESSLGILNSSLMESSRNTNEESSLGILNTSFMDSSRNTTEDSSLGILNSSYMDSSGEVLRCACGPDRGRSRSAEPSKRYTKTEKKIIEEDGKKIVRTSSTSRVTRTVPATSSQRSSSPPSPPPPPPPAAGAAACPEACPPTPPTPPATPQQQPTPPPPPPPSRNERSVQSSPSPTPRRNRRSGSDTSLTTTLHSINGRLTTIENNVVEIAGRIRDLHPSHSTPRRRTAEPVMPLKQRDRSDLSQKVVIPRGMINPGETTIIEIPASLHKEPVVVAKRKGVDPSRDPSCSRQPATPCYKGPAQESQRRPSRNISPNPSFTYTLNTTPEYQPAFNATLKGSRFDPAHHSSGYGSQMGGGGGMDIDQTEQRERAELQHLLDDFQRARRKLIDSTSKMANKMPPNANSSRGRDSYS